ncbi:MAG: hypothetical protein WCJ58_05795 [bacterium]
MAKDNELEIHFQKQTVVDGESVLRTIANGIIAKPKYTLWTMSPTCQSCGGICKVEITKTNIIVGHGYTDYDPIAQNINITATPPADAKCLPKSI